MAEIGARFIDRADAVKPGGRGSAETGQLGKDEPHPMSPLAARAQFGEDGFENRRLCRHKPLQIELGRCHLKPSSFTLLLYTSFTHYRILPSLTTGPRLNPGSRVELWVESRPVPASCPMAPLRRFCCKSP